MGQQWSPATGVGEGADLEEARASGRQGELTGPNGGGGERPMQADGVSPRWRRRLDVSTTAWRGGAQSGGWGRMRGAGVPHPRGIDRRLTIREAPAAMAISTGTEEDDSGALVGALLKEEGMGGEGRVEGAEAMMTLMVGTAGARLSSRGGQCCGRRELAGTRGRRGMARSGEASIG